MSIALEWNNDQSEIEIPEDWIHKFEELLQIVAAEEGITTEKVVSLSFVDNEAIQQLNKSYRGIDRPTDVLSFPMQEEGEEEQPFDNLLGDIIISLPRAKEQSEEYEHSLAREVSFLFVHGFLHLIGYDHHDETSEKEMFEKQEQALQKAGVER